MFFMWYLGFVVIFIIVVTVAMKMLNNTNKLRARSRRTKFCIYSMVFVTAVLLLTAMSFKGLISVPESWLGLLVGADIQIAGSSLVGGHNTATNKSSEFFGIMFDAGSTGSRIHVFKFRQNSDAQDGAYQLLDELFLSTKPGLSSFANDPSKAADSLRSMLDKAKEFIPSRHWSTTVLGLKATAGLRLLSNTTARAILDEVLKLFQSYQFKSSGSSVSILEGAEEGLFCWFTINFLKGLLLKPENTVGILDLGGGSTQITYLPSSGIKSDQLIPEGYLVDVQMLGQKLDFYTHSYLGLGINSMRFQTLGGKESAEAIKPGVFRSVCLLNNYSGKWKYAGVEHNISSESVTGSESHFDSCYAVVQSVVTKYKIDKPTNINKKTFYALSYYYDRAVDVNLIDSNAGGQVKVQDFLNAAKRICQEVSWNGDQFLCLDLCYISSLLTTGFGFDLTYTFQLKKKKVPTATLR